MARKKGQPIYMRKLVTPNGAVFRTAVADALMLQDYHVEAVTASTTDDDGNIIDSLRAQRAQAHLANKEVIRAYASVIFLASELRLPEVRACFAHKFDAASLKLVSWARSGIIHTQIRHDGATRAKTDARGESDYTCMFCFQSIQTFGWAPGVRSLPPAFTEKLEQHVGKCAVDYLVNYDRPREKWQLTPGVPPLVDHKNIVRETP